MARGASANTTAGMIQSHFETFGDVQNASGQPIVAIRELFRINLDGFAARKKRHFELLRRLLILYFLNIWIGPAHSPLPKPRPDFSPGAQSAPPSSSATRQGALSRDLNRQSVSGSTCNRCPSSHLEVPRYSLRSSRAPAAKGLRHSDSPE